MIALVRRGSRGCCRGLAGRLLEDEVEDGVVRLVSGCEWVDDVVWGGFGVSGSMCSKMCCGGLGEKSHGLEIYELDAGVGVLIYLKK